MSDTRFGAPPHKGTQVSMDSNGPSVTPYCVTVTKDGAPLSIELFTFKADAQRRFDEHRRAITEG